jgi:peptidyl-prolyl cis-trans isomerase C
MKSLSILTLSCLILSCEAVGWAQAPAPQAAPPVAPLAAPQATPPAAPAAAEKSDTVIAIFEDGVKMTAGEYQALVQSNPGWQGQTRENVLMKYGGLRKMAALARSQKLDQKSPYKETLEFSTMIVLAQFAATEAANSITVDSPEIEKFYNEHKEPYKQIAVKGLKVAFGGTAEPVDTTAMASRVPKKILTEEEAKAKAEKLVAQVRAGADFAKLVQTESDDDVSKAKGGDYGTWRTGDNVPEAMHVAVLGLKQGEVSEPVRQPNGFYLFYAAAVTYSPLAEVRDGIFKQLQQMRASEWVQNIYKSTKVEFPTASQPAAPGAAPAAPAK